SPPPAMRSVGACPSWPSPSARRYKSSHTLELSAGVLAKGFRQKPQNASIGRLGAFASRQKVLAKGSERSTSSRSPSRPRCALSSAGKTSSRVANDRRAGSAELGEAGQIVSRPRVIGDRGPGFELRKRARVVVMNAHRPILLPAVEEVA